MSDPSDPRIIRMITNLTKAKESIPVMEAENPSKDFARLRCLVDEIERAILADDEEAAIAAMLEEEQERFRLGILPQKHSDC